MTLKELANLIPVGQTILIKEHKYTKKYTANGRPYEEKEELLYDDRECLDYTENKYLLNKEVKYVVSGYAYTSQSNEDYIVIEVE